MKNKHLTLPFTLLLIASCTNTELPKRAKNKLNLPQDGFQFELFQRNQIAIPSSSNNVLCHIDDITGGQTHLTLKAGTATLVDKSIREGAVEYFTYNSGKYSIACLNLVNKIIGEDYGSFTLNKVSETKTSPNDESEQIEMLLKKIASSDVVFIRNGAEYTPKEAADHLRAKLNETNGQLKTLDGFIKQIASKSSVSGKPYLVKLKDGSILRAEEWYREIIINK